MSFTKYTKNTTHHNSKIKVTKHATKYGIFSISSQITCNRQFDSITDHCNRDWTFVLLYKSVIIIFTVKIHLEHIRNSQEHYA